MTQPLDDILVLDFSTLLPGPMATLMLAEAGAEVIKLERPGTGEDMRLTMPQIEGRSLGYAVLNRGKKSIALNLKAEGAVESLRHLIEKADVIVEQFRPGAMRGDNSPWMLELVAGVVESGESDEDVVHREAMEEAGCELSELLPIATVIPSAGACSEQVRLYCGRVSSASVGGIHGLQEEGEDILVHSVSRSDALQLLADDRIPNGHTLIALQWLHIHGASLRERWC